MSLRYKLTFIDVQEDRLLGGPAPRRSASLPCRLGDHQVPSKGLMESRYLVELTQRLHRGLQPTPLQPAAPVQHIAMDPNHMDEPNGHPLARPRPDFLLQCMSAVFVLKRSLDACNQALQRVWLR
mmetsp:Transcript_20778/g.48690  ORF Transcript_20778/g.48690 Transcript_20778/m.48690 type:complete len:125 (-) Transcript_20778:113-487(-)